jgi:hypothetical protein
MVMKVLVSFTSFLPRAWFVELGGSDAPAAPEMARLFSRRCHLVGPPAVRLPCPMAGNGRFLNGGFYHIK